MHPLLRKTFGGLTPSYYIRNFIFGMIFLVMMIVMMVNSPKESMSFGIIVFAVINTLLYPYARFVYESVVGFVMGENVFFVNAMMMLIVKFTTMAVCWSMAIFIAPLGLLYLYFHHSRSESRSAE
ncbi:MAG: hypothetical protein ACTJHW_10370 [Paenalcaligenes sp.]